MPKKQKKSVKKSQKIPLKLFANSGLRAIAVVIVVVALGALALPLIFAAQSGTVSSVRYTGGQSGNNYYTQVTWNGYSQNGFRVRIFNGYTQVLERNVGNNQRSTDFVVGCGANYTARVAAMNQYNQSVGNTGEASLSAPCPAPAPSPTPTPAPSPSPSPSPTPSQPTTPATTSPQQSTGGNTSSGGTTGGGSTKAPTTAKKPTTTTKRTTAPTVATATPAPIVPSKPGSFTASISSNKVVGLSWDAATNADRYVLSRSTDNATWQQITDTKDTSYKDGSADFSTTYYYQLQALSATGAASETATAQTTTEAFAATSNTVTSDDKKVTITVPDGAIDGEYSCTLGDDDSARKAPNNTISVLGPYDLLCVTADGEVVSEFNEPLTAAISLGESSKGYSDVSIQYSGEKGWAKVEDFEYDKNKQVISFDLTSAQSFGVFGVKQKGSAWIFILLILLLLGIAAAVFFILRRRHGQSDPYGGYTGVAPVVSSEAVVPVPPSAEDAFHDAIAQPDCTHVSMAQQVVPSSQGCYECEQQGTHWNSLRICLICGHVGCSDDSDQQHALKHFQATGHPLIYEYGNASGNSIGWCYIDQTYI